MIEDYNNASPEDKKYLIEKWGERLRDYDNERLRGWQEKYEQARSAYADSLDAFEGYAQRYDGAHDQGPGKPVSVVWNITKELIESQIDSKIPQPKVVPQRPTEKSIRLAKVIEDMLRNQIDRLPMEYINDEDDRTSKIMGGSGFWWNGITASKPMIPLGIYLSV